jgi:hypothetical protein
MQMDISNNYQIYFIRELFFFKDDLEVSQFNPINHMITLSVVTLSCVRFQALASENEYWKKNNSVEKNTVNIQLKKVK